MGIGLPNLEIELNVRSHRSLGVREGGVELLAARGYRRGRGTRDHCCHPSWATSDWSTAQTCDYEGQLHRQSSKQVKRMCWWRENVDDFNILILCFTVINLSLEAYVTCFHQFFIFVFILYLDKKVYFISACMYKPYTNTYSYI